MEYEFISAIQECIEDCKANGTGRVQKFDERGICNLWLDSEWVDYEDGIHDVIALYFCYSDTGRIAYQKWIEETKIEK